MNAVVTQAAGEMPAKGTTHNQNQAIIVQLDCLAYLMWVEKWLRSHGENRLADDYRELIEGESISLAA